MAMSIDTLLVLFYESLMVCSGGVFLFFGASLWCCFSICLSAWTLLTATVSDDCVYVCFIPGLETCSLVIHFYVLH